MQLMLGALKKKLKHDLKHDVEELDLPQATTASRILKDRSPDVTLLREASASYAERFEKENTASPGLRIRNGRAPLKKRASKRMRIDAIISFFILGTAPPQLLLRRGIFYLRKSSGSLAMACVNSSHGSRDQRPLARDVCDHW
jgi:hypothetical protein